MSLRVGWVLRAALLIFGFAFVALLLAAPRPAEAQTPPPLSGAWDVSDTTEWNTPVTLMGDLVVHPEGRLTLSDMTLTFWCFQKSEFGVKIEGGGVLDARHVVFRAQNASLPFKFSIGFNAVADLDGCTIMNVGSFGQTRDTWGVYIHSPFVTLTGCTVTRCNVGLLVHGVAGCSITGCNITDNFDRGIWVMYASPILAGNRLSNNSYGIYLEESPGISLSNNDLDANRREALAMDANSSVDAWTISAPVNWTGSTVLLRGNLTVRDKGTLVMRRCDLLMDSTMASRKTVRVLPGGTLVLDRSSVGAAAGGGDRSYAFIIEGQAGFTAEGSAIHGVGYDISVPDLAGPSLESDAWINGSDLSGNLVSLVSRGASLRLTNSTLNGTARDAWLVDSTARLLNVRFRPDAAVLSGAGSELVYGWHLNAGVVWQNGRGVSGATLSVRDGAGGALYDGATGPDGWVRWIEAYQYRLAHNGSAPLGELSLVARKAGFPDASRSVALTADREERLVFRDIQLPFVEVTSPPSGFGTNQGWLLVTGTARDDIGLDRVELRLDDSLRWLPLQAGDWSVNLTNLSRGDHEISVRATDIAGQTAYANFTFLVDPEPPRLELERPFDGTVLTNDPAVRFSGRTDPDATLTIDGVTVPIDAGGMFDTEVLLPEGRHDVAVAARDRGGNVVTATRTITVDLTPPSITVFSPDNGTRTRREELELVGNVEPGAKFRMDGSTVMLGPDGSFNVTVSLSGGPKDIELYAEDRAGNSNTTSWTLERVVDQQSVQTPLQKYGLLAALAAVLVVIVVAAAAMIILRRRKRIPVAHAFLVEPPTGR